MLSAIKSNKETETSRAIANSFSNKTVGNSGNKPLGIQTKLIVGKPNDKYEQEADRVADQVMTMPESGMLQKTCSDCEKENIQTKPLFKSITPLVQRQPGPEEDEEPIQTKLIQKQEAEDEEQVMTKINGNGSQEANSSIEKSINQSKGHGITLPDNTRSFMEHHFGTDFSHVRVHKDSNAGQLNKQLNSQAFTKGNDIYFNQGKYSPESSSGKHLLAHELTHVVQQNNSSNTNIIRRVCKPKVKRANKHPNEKQKADYRQLSTDPCKWILYGFHINRSEFMLVFSPVVNQLYNFLRTHSTARINIIGLNDCFGKLKHNIAVGNMRSQNVRNAFPSDVHGQITIVPSTGKDYLLPNSSAVNRAINRSVQIELIPPGGVSCPAQESIIKQTSPSPQAGCSAKSKKILIRSAQIALPLAITALARIRNWRNNRRTRQLLDIYYGTANKAEREIAAKRVANMLNLIILNLQKPVMDCLEPGHWAYSRICPASTIADAGGATVIRMATFCFPQFQGLSNDIIRAKTVLHEFSHRVNGTSDFGAYYITNNCDPTTSTAGLSKSLKLSHADSFSCLVSLLAILQPRN